MSVSSPLPVLLPQNVVPKSELTPYEWKPKRSPTDLMPVPAEERTHDQEMAMARQAMDGKVVKKVRPRRTVDYGGPMGRWALVSRYSLMHMISAETAFSWSFRFSAVTEDASEWVVCTIPQASPSVYHRCRTRMLPIECTTV